MHQWTFVFSNYSKRKQKWWNDFSNELSPSIDSKLLSIDLGNVTLNYEINTIELLFKFENLKKLRHDIFLSYLELPLNRMNR